MDSQAPEAGSTSLLNSQNNPFGKNATRGGFKI
jgi:hypothetical protein